MELEIIPKQDNIPVFDKKAIKIKHIEYYPSYDGNYEEDEITEELVSGILKQIPEGINVIFSLIPYGEEDTFEVICDGEWLAIGYSPCNDGEEQVYYSYNPSYADTEELSPLESGGQSPVEKYLAINDIEAGVKAAEYFIKFQPENPWSLDRGMNGITPGKATLKILYFNNIYDTILTCKHIISVL